MASAFAVSDSPFRRRRTAAESREAVLAAAMVEFARTGYRGTSTEAIAAAAGVSQPYVFRLFGNKQALFIAAAERGFTNLFDTFRSVSEAAIAAGEDPFLAMGQAYLGLLADRDQLLLQMQAYIAADDPAIRRSCQEKWQMLTLFLESLPGASPESVSGFLAAGMLLNVAAAIDLLSLAASHPWVNRCLSGIGLPAATSAAATPPSTPQE